jgi:hypothetical protein
MSITVGTRVALTDIRNAVGTVLEVRTDPKLKPLVVELDEPYTVGRRTITTAFAHLDRVTVV